MPDLPTQTNPPDCVDAATDRVTFPAQGGWRASMHSSSNHTPTVESICLAATLLLMRVTVLLGGPGGEREVSLVSGNAVADALEEAGHEVFRSDISPTNLSALDRPCDVVFPVLHGEFGEDGQLQRHLETRHIPFVGSGSRASSTAMDKLATIRLWRANGLTTPAFHVADRNNPTTGAINGPCVVKPIGSGSSIGVKLFRNGVETATLDCIHHLVEKDGAALVEELIDGIELTVGILFNSSLPPIRIVYDQGFFDYESKYSAAGAGHSFDTTLDESTVKSIRRDVEMAHQLVGARDLSRTDVMVDRSGKYFLLEINTMPGFTPRSLLPEAAAKAGVPFVQLVDRLVRAACARGGES